MTVWFVSHHPGECVIGSLSVHLAAEVCSCAAHSNLSLQVASEDRGRELSADELQTYVARLERFDIRKLP